MSEAQVEKIKFEYKGNPEDVLSGIASDIKPVYEWEKGKQPKYYHDEGLVNAVFNLLQLKASVFRFFIRTENGDYRSWVYNQKDYLILYSEFEKAGEIVRRKVSLIKLKDNIWFGEK